MVKKIVISIIAVVIALLTLFGLIYFFDKKEEQKIGGKLMKVHYRFSKEFDV
jgi:hypothetical protein